MLCHAAVTINPRRATAPPVRERQVRRDMLIARRLCRLLMMRTQTSEARVAAVRRVMRPCGEEVGSL